MGPKCLLVNAALRRVKLQGTVKKGEEEVLLEEVVRSEISKQIGAWCEKVSSEILDTPRLKPLSH